MCFFIPERLVKLEYLGKNDNEKEEHDEEASLFSEEIELAFFVVNFGYTKRDYEELTQLEKLFIMKAWENKKVLDSQLEANAFYNAYTNANRKKNTKAVPLWKKKTRKEDIELLKRQAKEIEKYEKQTNDKRWVDVIYGREVID